MAAEERRESTSSRLLGIEKLCRAIEQLLLRRGRLLLVEREKPDFMNSSLRLAIKSNIPTGFHNTIV